MVPTSYSQPTYEIRTPGYRISRPSLEEIVPMVVSRRVTYEEERRGSPMRGQTAKHNQCPDKMLRKRDLLCASKRDLRRLLVSNSDKHRDERLRDQHTSHSTKHHDDSRRDSHTSHSSKNRDDDWRESHKSHSSKHYDDTSREQRYHRETSSTYKSEEHPMDSSPQPKPKSSSRTSYEPSRDAHPSYYPKDDPRNRRYQAGSRRGSSRYPPDGPRTEGTSSSRRSETSRNPSPERQRKKSESSNSRSAPRRSPPLERQRTEPASPPRGPARRGSSFDRQKTETTSSTGRFAPESERPAFPHGSDDYTQQSQPDDSEKAYQSSGTNPFEPREVKPGESYPKQSTTELPKESVETPKRNAYEILGVSMDANTAQIRRRYLDLALVHHPDKADQPFMNLDESEIKARNYNMAEITGAYKILFNPGTRAEHDGEIRMERIRVGMQKKNKKK